MDLTEFSF